LTLPLDGATGDAMIAAHCEGNEALRAKVAELWASAAAKGAWVDKVRLSLSLSLYIYIYIYIHLFIYIYMCVCIYVFRG